MHYFGPSVRGRGRGGRLVAWLGDGAIYGAVVWWPSQSAFPMGLRYFGALCPARSPYCYPWSLVWFFVFVFVFVIVCSIPSLFGSLSLSSLSLVS